MEQGKVKWFDYNKGYGFIEPEDGNSDIFTVKRAGYTSLKDDQAISYEIDKAYRLKLKSQII